MAKSKRETPVHAVVHLRVQPKASRNSIRIEEDGRVRVALTAPPVEGEANRALCAFVAQVVGVAKSAVTVVGGARSREKTVAIEGLDDEEAQRKLAALGGSR